MSLLNWLKTDVYRTKKPLIIFTPNPEQLVLAHQSPQFNSILQRADILIPDGIGLVLASRLLKIFGRGEAISERISGIDLVGDLLELSSSEDWSALLLGGHGYHQTNSREIFSSRFGKRDTKTQLQWLEGYQNSARPTASEEQKVTLAIKKLRPKIVFVALGAPRQEQWVVEHLSLLKQVDTKVVMVVGGAFDVLFGKLKRAPWWLRGIGLEWLYRLVQEPHRWRRQLALFNFAWLVWLELWKKPVKN